MEKKEKKQAAVIGYPISHSLSPKLHNYWLNKYAILGEYKSYEVKPEELEDFILSLSDRNLSGINITVPHKERTYEILKAKGKLTDIALKTEAVNTVYYEEGNLVGTNTDYSGFKNSFLNQVKNAKLENKKILIIGAGGAAKAIIAGLLEEKENKIIIINRTTEKAENLAKKVKKTRTQEPPTKVDGLIDVIKPDESGGINRFTENKEKIEIGNLDNLEEKIEESDIIVNTTSCGLNGKHNLEIDFTKIKTQKIFYDIVYKPLETKFLKDAKTHGHETVTGIGMLIYQAAPAFKHFFGKHPEADKELENYMLTRSR